jgi:hypothetical protein
MYCSLRVAFVWTLALFEWCQKNDASAPLRPNRQTECIRNAITTIRFRWRRFVVYWQSTLTIWHDSYSIKYDIKPIWRMRTSKWYASRIDASTLSIFRRSPFSANYVPPPSENCSPYKTMAFRFIRDHSLPSSVGLIKKVRWKRTVFIILSD